MSEQKHIVIVGGGAGGLELATSLGKKLGRKGKARITLIDAVLTHVWKPLLHEVAAGALDAGTSEVNYRAHAKQHGFEFQLGRMVGLDRESREVILSPVIDDYGNEVVPERRAGYDYLVIAVGSTTSDFGIKGVQEHSVFLDSLDQARRYHKLLLNTFLHCNYLAEHNEDCQIRISIVGAGATGVELAAEMRLASHELPLYGMNHLKTEDVKIDVIEAADRILPALPERLANAATKELKRLNINVITGQPVSEMTETSVVLKDGTELKADIKVWAAGIKAPPFLQDLGGLETNKGNQLVVNQNLTTTRDEHIFALGDCASCPQPNSDKPVPPRAQAAHQQASTLEQSLLNVLQDKAPVDYVYKDRGSLISFSKYTAVGNLMGNLSGRSMVIEGRVARFFYITLYRMHQVALHGYLRTALIWFGDRITKALRPRLKLH